MKVSELIEHLKQFDGNLEVSVSSSDHDYDWMALHPEHISIKPVLDCDAESDEPMIEMRLCLGDGYV